MENKLRNLKNLKSLLIATNNKGKLLEIKKLLPKNIVFYNPKDFNLTAPIENEKTFEGNAANKPRFCAVKTKLVSLSDDSGLEISTLNRDPGVYSARWAGKNKDFRLAIKKVYSKINKINKINKARFYCSLAIAFPNGTYKTFSGTVNGKISKEPKGDHGFGYDPIFIPNGYKKTFGEMKSNLKDKMSHRYKAFNKIKKYFKY
ncbi:MAG: RdgB/HAM1 family non-canonical purine NTP pyrophosphatase [Candidatus Fonsibacter lacus]